MVQDTPRRLLIVVHEALFFMTHRLPVGLAMKAAGWEVHVAGPEDAAVAQKLARLGIAFHPIPLARGGMNPLAEIGLVWALWRLMRQLRPGLVHLVSMKPVLWGGMAARLAGVPAAVHAITGLGFIFIRQDWKARLLRLAVLALYRFALAHPNAVAIFQNGDDRALFERHRLVRPSRVVLIRGCGVDMAAFPARPEPSELDPAAPPVVMFPARLLGDKGIREFAGAVEIIRARGLPARFVLVGRHDPDNPTDIGPATLRQWLDQGLVEYWGYSEDMAATLAQSDLVVLPSYREGLPRGLIEAAATQRAIVTANVPGCREVVRHNETGLLAPVRDTPATAAAIAMLLADPALRRRMGRAARAYAEAEFSVEHFVAESLKAYDRVLAPLGQKVAAA